LKKGFLSQYFKSVATKRLSAVESDLDRSHQHEFNGSRELKSVLGTGSGDKVEFKSRFIWFGSENEGIVSDGFVSWYDSRKNTPNRSEYRLYFPSNEVTELACEGDSLFIARRTDDTLLLIIAASDTTIDNQLYWLFDITKQLDFGYTVQDFNEDDVEIDFTTRFILDELGVDIEEPDSDRLDDLLKDFGTKFPSTQVFSDFARKNIGLELSPLDEPDKTLMEWLNFEESLFRRLERHIVSERIEKSFSDDSGTDVDGFINFSLSVQNRRKSRAGLSLENHLANLFDLNDLKYQRGARTENNKKPDFLFPNSECYHNLTFNAEGLTMLGVKRSLKDRWRQVLSEANRIKEKHLLTLESSISVNQTDEMVSSNLNLVVPREIHKTYNESQKQWLMDISQFIRLVKSKS